MQGLDPKQPDAATTLAKLEQGFEAHGSLGGNVKVGAFRAALTAKRKAADEHAHSQLAPLANESLVKINPEHPADYHKLELALKELQPWEALYGHGNAKGLAAAYFKMAKQRANALAEAFQHRHDAACRDALAKIQKLPTEQPDFHEQLHKTFEGVSPWLTSGVPDPGNVGTQLKTAHKEKLEAGQKPKQQHGEGGAAANAQGSIEPGKQPATAAATPQVKPAEAPTGDGGAHARAAGGSHPHALKAGDEQKYMALHGESAEVRPQLKPDELLAKIGVLRAHPQWGPVIAHIPDPQLMALIGYTSSDYRMLNSALRGEQDPAFVAKLRPYISLTQDALARLPDYAGMCWRGVELTPQQRVKYKPGKTVEEPHFFSTSSSEKSAFKGNTRFTIESKHGKIIDFLSHHGAEKECLFMAGSHFLVLSVEEKQGTVSIRMRQV